MSTPFLTRILALAGAIPFVGCAGLIVLGVGELPVLGATDRVLAAYALTIAAFMAGVHWGTHLQSERQPPTNLLVASNVVAVAAWLAFLLRDVRATLALMAILFAFLLWIDRRLLAAGFISAQYWTTRLTVTGIVIAALIAACVAMSL